MPRIWMDYCAFLMDQGRITLTRRTLDRALRALPITQHDRIWPLLLKFADSNATGPHEMSLRIYRRYIKVCARNGFDKITFTCQCDCRKCYFSVLSGRYGTVYWLSFGSRRPQRSSNAVARYHWWRWVCQQTRSNKACFVEWIMHADV